MKTTLIRAFVVALALTGAFAATHAAPTTKAAVSPIRVSNAPPVPICPPDDPDGCGIGG